MEISNSDKSQSEFFIDLEAEAEKNKHSTDSEAEVESPFDVPPQPEIEDYPEIEPEVSPEEVAEQLMGDREWLKELIDAEYSELPESVRQEIIEKYTQEEVQKSFKEKLAEKLKDIPGAFTAGGVAGFLGKVGAGYALGLAKTAARATLFGGSLAGGVIVGAAAGAGYTGIRTWFRERKKVDSLDVKRQIQEAIAIGDLLLATKIVAKAEQSYKAGEFRDDEQEDIRRAILSDKVALDLSVQVERLKGDHPDNELIEMVLKSSTQARKELSKDDKKDVKALLRSVSLKKEKNEFKNYKGKLGKAMLKGALVGAVGGAIGGFIHSYFAGAETGVAETAVGKPLQVTAVEQAIVDKKAETVIASTASSVEEMRNQMLEKKFTAVAEKGDGALKLYRQAVHDYLVNDENNFAGEGPISYSKEQLIYAEEYLNKHANLDFADGTDSIDPKEVVYINATDIQEALRHAAELDKNQTDNLEKLLSQPEHTLSEDSLKEMYKLELEVSDNDFSYLKPKLEVLEIVDVPDMAEASTESIIEVAPEEQVEVSPEVPVAPPLETGVINTKEKINWAPWVAGGALAATALAGGAYAIRRSYLKGKERGEFEHMVETAPQEGYVIEMPEENDEARKAWKQSGKIHWALNRNKNHLNGRIILIEVDEDYESRVDSAGNIFLNTNDSQVELDQFLQSLEPETESVQTVQEIEQVEDVEQTSEELIPSVEKSEIYIIPQSERELFKTQAETEPDVIRISGDPFYGRRLESHDLIAAGLEPNFAIKFENAELKISRPYHLSGGRLGIMAYVKGGNGTYTARSYYRSNSSGLWRYLPTYSPDGRGGVAHFNKAFGEESLAAPAEMQMQMSRVTSDSNNILTVENPYFYFAGTCKDNLKDGTIIREVNHAPEKYSGVFKSDNERQSSHRVERRNPRELKFEDPEYEPDFSKPLLHWKDENKLYGKYEVRSYASKNGELSFLYCEDERQRVWIGGIEVKSKIGSTGLREKWFDGGDMTMPAYEYDIPGDIDQTGGYGNQKDRKGNYVDVFQTYLKHIKIIDDYIKFRGINTEPRSEEPKQEKPIKPPKIKFEPGPGEVEINNVGDALVGIEQVVPLESDWEKTEQDLLEEAAQRGVVKSKYENYVKLTRPDKRNELNRLVESNILTKESLDKIIASLKRVNFNTRAIEKPLVDAYVELLKSINYDPSADNSQLETEIDRISSLGGSATKSSLKHAIARVKKVGQLKINKNGSIQVK